MPVKDLTDAKVDLASRRAVQQIRLRLRDFGYDGSSIGKQDLAGTPEIRVSSACNSRQHACYCVGLCALLHLSLSWKSSKASSGNTDGDRDWRSQATDFEERRPITVIDKMRYVFVNPCLSYGSNTRTQPISKGWSNTTTG